MANGTTPSARGGVPVADDDAPPVMRLDSDARAPRRPLSRWGALPLAAGPEALFDAARGLLEKLGAGA